MQPGDEFLATIRVRYTGQTTCGGGREFEDVPNYSYNFDEGDFDSLEPVPRLLPTEPGSVVKIETLDETGPITAVLREDGVWATSRAGYMSVMDSADIQDLRWIPLT